MQHAIQLWSGQGQHEAGRKGISITLLSFKPIKMPVSLALLPVRQWVYHMNIK